MMNTAYPSLHGRVKWGLALALGLTVAIGGVSLRSIVALVDAMHAEIRSHQILNELHDVLLVVKSAQSGQRSYLITGQTRHLAPYRQARDGIAAELDALDALIDDGPADAPHRQALNALDPLIANKFDLLGEAVLRRQEGDVDAAHAMVHIGAGAALMDEITHLVTTMTVRESAALIERGQRAEALARQTTAFVVLAVALALAGFAVALLAIGREARERHRAERDLRRANDGLERQVVQRTRELTAANHGLQHEAAERERASAQLEAARNDLLAILDQQDVGAVLIDGQGQIGYASRAMQALLADGDGPIGRHWSAALLLSAQDRTAVQAMLDRPAAQRARVCVHLAPRAGARFRAEVEVRDEARGEGRRILLFDAVTRVHAGARAAVAVESVGALVAASAAMHAVLRQIREIAPLPSTVLIEGETGTGKELAARAIHDSSPRRGAPFVAVNCAGLTDALLSSELFGHRKGAFTGATAEHRGLFEAAQGGSVFLDEIGDISASVQTLLLRVLQEREVLRLGETSPRKIDVRVIVATQHDLDAEVAKGRFRADLLYRIRVARLALPPLRERRADVVLLAQRFLQEQASAIDKPVREFSDAAMRALTRHRWPGNVRELKSAIEYAVIRSHGVVLLAADLPPEVTAMADGAAGRSGADLGHHERIQAALVQAGGNHALAARLLGIGRATLYRRLKASQAPTR
jgi:sigma-54 dependent transcriptional regulator, acetoin dehydrogenase operon transcriptional activator AcoR